MAEGKDNTRVRTTQTRSFAMHPGDIELIRWASAYLSCSGSEFVRTAIRAQATSLQQIAGKR